MGVTVQWLKSSLNKFRERFQIRDIREIKDPRNISAIRYYGTISAGTSMLESISASMNLKYMLFIPLLFSALLSSFSLMRCHNITTDTFATFQKCLVEYYTGSVHIAYILSRTFSEHSLLNT